MNSNHTGASTVPVELHDAIDRAMERVVELFMTAISEAVRAIGPNHPTNVAEATRAIAKALMRIEVVLAPGAELDNHHNAIACPYCNPNGLQFAPQLDLRTVATEIADALFTNGSGDRAKRLVLTIDGPPKRDLGGWTRPTTARGRRDGRILRGRIQGLAHVSGPRQG